MEITIHTGCQGANNIIWIDWFNHNGIRRQDKIEIDIQEKDKPRTLEIKLNDAVLAIIENKE